MGIVAAFGEEKTVRAWSRDERCPVGYNTVRVRIRQGMDPYDALFTPIPRITAFGETKSIHAWCKDPRCKVSYNPLVKRLARGVPPEEAIAKPPKSKDPNWKYNMTWQEMYDALDWFAVPQIKVDIDQESCYRVTYRCYVGLKFTTIDKAWGSKLAGLSHQADTLEEVIVKCFEDMTTRFSEGQVVIANTLCEPHFYTWKKPPDGQPMNKGWEKL